MVRSGGENEICLGVRMRKSIKNRLILIVVGILLVLVGVRGVALVAVGKTTQATVTEVKKEIGQSSDPMDHNYQISYRFAVEGKQYNGAFTRKKVYNTATLPSVGALVSVRYIAQIPAVNGGSDTTPLGGILLGVLGLFLLFLGIKPARKTRPLADQQTDNPEPQ